MLGVEFEQRVDHILIFAANRKGTFRAKTADVFAFHGGVGPIVKVGVTGGFFDSFRSRFFNILLIGVGGNEFGTNITNEGSFKVTNTEQDVILIEFKFLSKMRSIRLSDGFIIFLEQLYPGIAHSIHNRRSIHRFLFTISFSVP